MLPITPPGTTGGSIQTWKYIKRLGTGQSKRTTSEHPRNRSLGIRLTAREEKRQQLQLDPEIDLLLTHVFRKITGILDDHATHLGADDLRMDIKASDRGEATSGKAFVLKQGRPETADSHQSHTPVAIGPRDSLDFGNPLRNLADDFWEAEVS